MLAAVFGFRGRINRLQYFLGALALGAALVVPLLLIVGSIGLHAAAGPRPGLLASLGGQALFALVAVPLFLWVALSLQARRFRDIGWNPLYVIPGLIAVGVVDALVARAAPAISIGALHNQTPLGLTVSLAAAAALLFWPGKAKDDDDAEAAAWADWPEPDEPTVLAPAPARAASSAFQSAPTIRVPAPVQPRPAAPAGPSFGRRGL